MEQNWEEAVRWCTALLVEQDYPSLVHLASAMSIARAWSRTTWRRPAVSPRAEQDYPGDSCVWASAVSGAGVSRWIRRCRGLVQ